MRFPTATYNEEIRLNQGAYETKNEPIMAATAQLTTGRASYGESRVKTLWYISM